MATFIKTSGVGIEIRSGAFVIRKIHSVYLVNILETVVLVTPLQSQCPAATGVIIASTLQMVGNSKLLIHKPDDPIRYLMDYYKDLGWSIEIAD